jgi:hypothetical protein
MLYILDGEFYPNYYLVRIYQLWSHFIKKNPWITQENHIPVHVHTKFVQIKSVLT